MAAPDFRINLPAPKIDFTNNVGITNTDIDNYPPPQGQARYDHLRSIILGLLTNQASFNEPNIMSDGSLWFDLNDNTLKIRRVNEWVKLSESIPLGNPVDGVHLTLNDWYEASNVVLSSLTQEIVFNGTSTANSVIDIPIPSSLQQLIYTDTRCFFYINGLLLDPRNNILIGSPSPTTIRLNNTSLNIGDNFTVIMRQVPASSFYTATVGVS